MRILALISREYGERMVENIRSHAPANWTVQVWRAPAILPPVIDYPEDHLPETLPAAGLILSFGEHPGVAELLPDIARLSGAGSVIAGVDNEAWLPRGLARQLRRWLGDMGVACVTPKPLCSLTESSYLIGRRQRIQYDDATITEFARYFGQPELTIAVNPKTRSIVSVTVVRDSVCGCARHVASGLTGVSADDAEEKAGLLHHHYPCQATMGIDTDFGDTLMHVSGNILKAKVGAQVKRFKQVLYIIPGPVSGST